MMGLELKPNRKAFVTYRFALSQLGIFIVLGVFYLMAWFAVGLPLLFFPVIYAAFALLNYVSLKVRYRKEVYSILHHRVLRKGGGIFSDVQSELVIRNITHVKLRLPFLEHKIFGTGHISIQSAGSGSVEVYMRSVDRPKAVYDRLQELMRDNGFRMTKAQLVQEERPHTLGVILEILKNLGGAALFGFFIGFELVFLVVALLGLAVMLLILVLILAVLVLGLTFRFLDLKNRRYRVFTDAVTYKEGFLTKNYAFMPIENLADSESTQTMVDRLLGLYDVKVSCQGSQQEIHFKNMANGEALEHNIDRLIAENESLVGTGPKVEEKERPAELLESGEGTPVVREKQFVGSYKMDAKRTLLPLALVLLAFSPLVVLMVIVPALCVGLCYIVFIVGSMFGAQAIKLISTTYLIKPMGMEERQKFFSARNKEFSNEKIMGVVFKENFMDRWFDTCSIRFWSIGSAQSITFQNIRNDPGLWTSVLAKVGIWGQEPAYRMNSNFSLGDMFKANLPITVLLAFITGLLILGSIYFPFLLFGVLIVGIIVAVAALRNYLYYPQSRLTFYQDYVHFARGILFKEYYYALYDNIKDITTLRYPFSSKGKIGFNVAGETLQGSGKHQTLVSNSFTINYIEAIDTKDELIDLLFYQRPEADDIRRMETDIKRFAPQPIAKVKPALANTMIPAVIAAGILMPLLLLPFLFSVTFLYPLSIILIAIVVLAVVYAYLRVKSRVYIIQPYRVLGKWGVLYRGQTSVVFSKIDHLNLYQGALNKLFDNGNVSVNTTGSSRPELVIKNIPGHGEFYDTLKRYY